LDGGTYEFGANVISVPPDHFVRSILGYAFAGKEQNEFIENFDTIELKPNTFGRNIAHETESRRNTNPEFDSSQPPQATAWAPAFFLEI
jgi:hypothetical protein